MKVDTTNTYEKSYKTGVRQVTISTSVVNGDTNDMLICFIVEDLSKKSKKREVNYIRPEMVPLLSDFLEELKGTEDC